ncbi:agmatine deiminase [Pseudomonas aeruginosa]|nr:agmatine deiminase [Pseudomonas aeruginosa]
MDIVEGSQPRDPSTRLAGSYVNFLIVNGGIVAPSFDDPKDAEARAILQRVFPEHEVVMVPGREILLGGGQHPLHHPAATGAAQGLSSVQSTDSAGWLRNEKSPRPLGRRRLFHAWPAPYSSGRV